MIRINLRSPRSEATYLSRKQRSSSPFVGVRVRVRKTSIRYLAYVTDAKETFHLGSFIEEEDAARARDAAVIARGLPYRLNFPVSNQAPLGSRLIALTRGLFSVVDADVYDTLNRDLWIASACGYAVRKSAGADSPLVWMHREIMHCPEGRQVDHVNGDRLDNRRCNLRIVPASKNALNRRKQRSAASSDYLGVDLFKPTGTWRSRVAYKGRTYDLGLFSSEYEAALVRDQKALELDPEHFSLNFPELRDLAQRKRAG